MPDNSGAVDLGALSPEEQEAVRNMASQAPEPDGPVDAQTAFVVMIDPSGQIHVGQYDGEALALVDSEPNDDVIYGACATILKDLTAKETARHTIHLQMMQAQAMQRQFQDQQLAAQVAQDQRRV